MRRKSSILIILALLFCLMLYLRSNEKKSTETETASAEQTESVSEKSVSVQKITLGTISENEEGGIVITVPRENDTVEEVVFTDVEKDAWYADAVNYVVSAGLMSGSDDGEIFLPEYGIRRLEYAIVLYRYAGGTEGAPKCNFSDISGNEWFAEYIDWISDAGYMGGQEDGAFDPYGYLTVEQAIVVLYRYSGEPYVDGSLADYPYAPKITESAIDAMTWAWSKGLIAEEECVWYPTQAISRAQVALLLTRCSELLEPDA